MTLEDVVREVEEGLALGLIRFGEGGYLPGEALRFELVPVNEIRVGRRARRNLGDIPALARDIDENTMLQWILLDEDRRLVAGRRRLEAARCLGWEEIPAVVGDFSDPDRLSAEVAENIARKDLAPSELVRAGRAILARERAAARERRREGGRRGGQASGESPEASRGNVRDIIARRLGVSGQTWTRMLAVVEAAEQDPERYGDLIDLMDQGRAHSVAGVWQLLQRRRIRSQIELAPPEPPDGTFDVIVVDPPWRYGPDESLGGISPMPYPTMDIAEIAALPIRDHAKPTCVLWLWTTNHHIRFAWDILDAWGFEYRNLFTWVKTRRLGLGRWGRANTEHVLLATRGRATDLVVMENQPSAFEEAPREHSRKPEVFYGMVEETCLGLRRLDYFAREARDGWEVFGAETDLFADETPGPAARRPRRSPPARRRARRT
jgi:N6-adenosine-specific RNA methylase IME4/general stress protein YciG